MRVIFSARDVAVAGNSILVDGLPYGCVAGARTFLRNLNIEQNI